MQAITPHREILMLSLSLFFLLIGISLKDFREGIIPNLYLALIVLLGLLHWGTANLLSVFILGGGAYTLSKLFFLLRGYEGLGQGDVKMFTACGLWVDPLQIPLFLMLSGSIGVGLGLLWYFWKEERTFPFGPALAFALGACIVSTSPSSIGAPMSYTFSGPQLPPASGNKPDSLVVFLHGYGADGADLISIGKAWSTLLPDTLFVSPHGPAPSTLNPFGNQWFHLDDWDPSHLVTVEQKKQFIQEMEEITPAFNQYIDALLKTHEISPERLAFVGFSQGTMFALHIALRRPSCTAVVGYSGAFLNDDKGPLLSHPSILLIHGEADTLVPPYYSETAESHLKALNIPVSLELLPDLAHGINEKGLALGGVFLKKHLSQSHEHTLWKPVKESNN